MSDGDGDGDPGGRNAFGRLGVRLALLLAIALSPLLLIAIVQSLSMMREARARSEAALMGETLRAVSGETRLIQQAQAEARLLSDLVPPLIADPAACSALMRRVAKADGHLSLAAFIPLDGHMSCASTGRSFDFSGNPLFDRMIAEPEPSFAVYPDGPISKASILRIAQPVTDSAGNRLGVISLSLPHTELASAEDAQAPASERPLVIMTFDSAGNILTSSAGIEEAPSRLPVGHSLQQLARDRATTFTAESRRGNARVYSVVELVPDLLYALGSWPADAAFGSVTRFPPVLFPALMWAASLFVAYFAMQKLVIGHVQRLSRALASFASGSRIVGNLEVEGAPQEIRNLAETYEKMTETILHDEAELEDMIHHKEVLLREVHHRVKNNLQLIASIINMQMRKAHSPEAKGLMRSLQERVISLATIHRGLYQTSGLSDISANELIPDIVRQITRLATGPGRRIEVTTRIAPIRLTPDQAVPLSLLVTEAMTNAMKYASADTGMPKLSVTLQTPAPGRAELVVRNTVATAATEPTPPEAAEGTGLGSQLVGAFVQQLGGQMQVDALPGSYALTVQFDLRPLDEAELRHEERARG